MCTPACLPSPPPSPLLSLPLLSLPLPNPLRFPHCSYIFSQTLFTRRTNCPSRLIGWVVTISELLVCVITVDPLAYVPLLFFAATLSFIGAKAGGKT